MSIFHPRLLIRSLRLFPRRPLLQAYLTYPTPTPFLRTRTTPIPKPMLEILEQVPQIELQRQWRWAIAEELLPLSKEEKIDRILQDVERMEVWIDDVGEKVRTIKGKLDEMEEEGGVILMTKKVFVR